MLSPEVAGPQASSAGRAATRSAIEIGAIVKKIVCTDDTKDKRWIVDNERGVKIIGGKFLCRENVAGAAR